MSKTRNRNLYVDFTAEPAPLGALTSTAATLTAGGAPTGADTTATTYQLLGGKRLEIYHDGATTVKGPITSTNGWTYPIAAGLFGAQLSGGALQPGFAKFTVGTDPAFFVRCKFKSATLAKQLALMVGFRKSGSYVATTSAASLQGAYDDKYLLGTIDSGANWTAETSVGGVDTQKAVTAPASPLVNTDTYDVKITVSAAGVVSATVNGAAVTGAAATYTFTNALDLVPVVVLINPNGGAACDALFVEYEHGLVRA